MIEIIIRTEEVVVRETSVLVPDSTVNPEEFAELKFWRGEYNDSTDIDRRNEKIVNVRRTA